MWGRRSKKRLYRDDRHGAVCGLFIVASGGITAVCKKLFIFLLILLVSSWVTAKESSFVCSQSMSPSKVRVLAPFSFAIFRASLVGGARIVDVLRLEAWVEHLREGQLTNLFTEQESLRHPRLYAAYSAIDVAIANFADFPIIELVTTGEEFLQRFKESEQQERQEIKATEKLVALDQSLIESAKLGDLLKIKELLEKGVNVEARDNTGNTALIWAAWAGHADVTQVLIAAGADLEARDNAKDTALIAAFQGGRADIVRTLFSAGAKLRFLDYGERTHLNFGSDCFLFSINNHMIMHSTNPS